MSNTPADPVPEDYTRKPKRNLRWLLYPVILLAALFYAASAFTIYSIPNNDEATIGAAFLVKQGPSMPFFDSPDAYCLRKFNNTNFICRADALDLIVFVKFYFEVPYMKWMYLASTGGRTFNQ